MPNARSQSRRVWRVGPQAPARQMPARWMRRSGGRVLQGLQTLLGMQALQGARVMQRQAGSSAAGNLESQLRRVHLANTRQSRRLPQLLRWCLSQAGSSQPRRSGGSRRPLLSRRLPAPQRAASAGWSAAGGTSCSNTLRRQGMQLSGISCKEPRPCMQTPFTCLPPSMQAGSKTSSIGLRPLCVISETVK